jgi:hypothetical protein
MLILAGSITVAYYYYYKPVYDNYEFHGKCYINITTPATFTHNAIFMFNVVDCDASKDACCPHSCYQSFSNGNINYVSEGNINGKAYYPCNYYKTYVVSTLEYGTYVDTSVGKFAGPAALLGMLGAALGIFLICVCADHMARRNE